MPFSYWGKEVDYRTMLLICNSTNLGNYLCDCIYLWVKPIVVGSYAGSNACMVAAKQLSEVVSVKIHTVGERENLVNGME